MAVSAAERDHDPPRVKVMGQPSNLQAHMHWFIVHVAKNKIYDPKDRENLQRAKSKHFLASMRT